MFHSLPISRRTGSATAAMVLLAAFACPADAAGIQVVASIKPVHSLASAVMEGLGRPHLLMRGSSSPHTYSLRPSDAERLGQADVVFLVDESLESTIAGSLASIAGKARLVELSGAHGLVIKPFREGGLFEVDPHPEDEHDDEHEAHEDEDHAEDEHHAEDEDHANEMPDEDHDEEHHEHGHEHEHGGFDPHIWLDPENARKMVHMIADTLAQVDPSNADRYTANARALDGRLGDLATQVAADMEPVRGRPFIVFHDGYRYFQDRFGLTAVGSAVVSPERPPGVKRLRELRTRIREAGVVCVFDEPQFDNGIVSVIVEGTGARTGTVDPLGAAIEEGPELYFKLIRNMAASFRGCLAETG